MIMPILLLCYNNNDLIYHLQINTHIGQFLRVTFDKMLLCEYLNNEAQYVVNAVNSKGENCSTESLFYCLNISATEND